jgi:hypothetical protein
MASAKSAGHPGSRGNQRSKAASIVWRRVAQYSEKSGITPQIAMPLDGSAEVVVEGFTRATV